MTFKEIEQRVADLDVDQGFDFIFELLRAYGLPKATVTRLKKGTSNKAKRKDEVLLKGKVYYRFLEGPEDLHVVIDDVRRDELIGKQRPRFARQSTAAYC